MWDFTDPSYEGKLGRDGTGYCCYGGLGGFLSTVICSVSKMIKAGAVKMRQPLN